jgi:hypothetical protein
MPIKRILGLLLLVTCGGCADRTFIPAAEVPSVPEASETEADVSDEVARCQATGTSEKECLDSHFVAPAPAPVVALSVFDMIDLAALTLREERHEAWLRAHGH